MPTSVLLVVNQILAVKAISVVKTGARVVICLSLGSSCAEESVDTDSCAVFGCFWQVLEVVRSNYDTLTLKLQDGLDQYERYSEQHKEAAFFKELVSCLGSEQSTALFQSLCLWPGQLYLGCS